MIYKESKLTTFTSCDFLSSAYILSDHSIYHVMVKVILRTEFEYAASDIVACLFNRKVGFT